MYPSIALFVGLLVLAVGVMIIVFSTQNPTAKATGRAAHTSPETTTTDSEDEDETISTRALPGHDVFPVSWGPPPSAPMDVFQFKSSPDAIALPGGYGLGSVALASWVQANLDREAEEAETESKAYDLTPDTSVTELELLPHFQLEGCARTSTLPTQRNVVVESSMLYQLGDCRTGSAIADMADVALARGWESAYVKRIYLRYQGSPNTGYETDATVVYVNGFPVMRVFNRYNLAYESGTKARGHSAEVRVLVDAVRNPVIELRSASRSDSKENHMKILSARVLCSESVSALTSYDTFESTTEGLGLGSERIVDTSLDLSTLQAGERLYFNEYLMSNNELGGKFTATVNDMGQLIVRNATGTDLWRSRGPDVSLTRTTYSVHPTTGQLIQQNGDEVIWRSKAAAPRDSVLRLHSNGVLAIEKNAIRYWSSDDGVEAGPAVGQRVSKSKQRTCPFKVAGRWDDAGGVRCCPSKNWKTHGNLRGYCRDIPDGGECSANSQCASKKCHKREYGKCPNGVDCEPKNTCAINV